MFVFVLFKNGCLFGLLVVDIYFLKKLFKGGVICFLVIDLKLRVWIVKMKIKRKSNFLLCFDRSL